MALQECGLNLNRVSKELQPHGSLEFPCAGYSSHHTEKQEDIIPWHWHEEIEIAYIEHGKMRIKIPSKTFLLDRGDCVVINANMLHYAVAAPECRLHSLVFSPALITGNDDEKKRDGKQREIWQRRDDIRKDSRDTEGPAHHGIRRFKKR